MLSVFLRRFYCPFITPFRAKLCFSLDMSETFFSPVSMVFLCLFSFSITLAGSQQQNLFQSFGFAFIYVYFWPRSYLLLLINDKNIKQTQSREPNASRERVRLKDFRFSFSFSSLPHDYTRRSGDMVWESCELGNTAGLWWSWSLIIDCRVYGCWKFTKFISDFGTLGGFNWEANEKLSAEVKSLLHSPPYATSSPDKPSEARVCFPRFVSFPSIHIHSICFLRQHLPSEKEKLQRKIPKKISLLKFATLDSLLLLLLLLMG